MSEPIRVGPTWEHCGECAGQNDGYGPVIHEPDCSKRTPAIVNTEAVEPPVFTEQDHLRLTRLAASYEFRARTTRHLDEANEALAVAEHLHQLAAKIAEHIRPALAIRREGSE